MLTWGVLTDLARISQNCLKIHLDFSKFTPESGKMPDSASLTIHEATNAVMTINNPVQSDDCILSTSLRRRSRRYANHDRAWVCQGPARCLIACPSPSEQPLPAGEKAGFQERDLKGETGVWRLGNTVDSLLVGTRSRLSRRGVESGSQRHLLLLLRLLRVVHKTGKRADCDKCD